MNSELALCPRFLMVNLSITINPFITSPITNPASDALLTSHGIQCRSQLSSSCYHRDDCMASPPSFRLDLAHVKASLIFEHRRSWEHHKIIRSNLFTGLIVSFAACFGHCSIQTAVFHPFLNYKLPKKGTYKKRYGHNRDFRS